MKRVLSDMLAEAEHRFAPPVFQRNTIPDPGKLKVQTIVGPRRAGKSSLLKLSIAGLLDSGVPWSKICYLPLEDERLRGEAFEPDLILQAFQELHPENETSRDIHFIFDEIQYLQNWEAFVNRVYEQVSRHVVITGSNSKTLHTEVAAVLRGRGLPQELLPLSFSEYLVFKNLRFGTRGPEKATVISAFRDYLLWGGFPEITFVEPVDKRAILQEYFNTLLYRDIIDQQQTANYSYLRYLFHRIAANTGKATSLRKIFLELKSRGYAVSQGSLYQMADLAESVYMYKRISRFDPSLIRRENAEKKVYFIDNGMLHAINGSFSSNWGTLLENLIFWHLYRMYGNIYSTDIYYYADQSYECDFILYREGGQALPVQVCWQMSDEETRQRELKALAKACRYTGSSKGVVITLEEEDHFNYQDIEIHVLAAWKWCAEEGDLFGM